MNAMIALSPHRPVIVPQRPFERESYAEHSYWIDGVLSCGCCDSPIYGGECPGCEIQFHGEHPAEPAFTRTDYHDSSIYLSEVRAARHFGRSGYGA